MNFQDQLIHVILETLKPGVYVPSERRRDPKTGKPDPNFAKKLFKGIGSTADGGERRMRGLKPSSVKSKFGWAKSKSPEIATGQAKRGWKAMGERLKTLNKGKAVKTNPKMADMMQVDLNRSDLSKKPKPGFPNTETKKEAKADWDRDKYRRQAPGDK
tara:strand:- start:84 stop:557 length:474 start_codon:yes stop_codon:yes gene_type:complete